MLKMRVSYFAIVMGCDEEELVLDLCPFKALDSVKL